MTLLNTISNLGGTWPKYFVLEAVDHFTVSKCSMDPANAIDPLYCTDTASKALCASLNTLNGETNTTVSGVCETLSDGYYSVGTGCFLLGVVTFFLVIRPIIAHVESLPEVAWRLTHTKSK